MYDFNPRLRPLDQQLRDARKAIIGLMSEPLQEILDLECNRPQSGQELSAWKESALEKVMAHAKPWEPTGIELYVSLSPRAKCPLCGGSTHPMNQIEGFAIPIGLRSHLLGTHRANQCTVFFAAEELNYSYLVEHEKQEAEQHAQARRELAKSKRKTAKTGAVATR